MMPIRPLFSRSQGASANPSSPGRLVEQQLTLCPLILHHHDVRSMIHCSLSGSEKSCDFVEKPGPCRLVLEDQVIASVQRDET